MEQSDSCNDLALGLDGVSYQKRKKRYYSLITALPASFMSAVSMTYILMAEEGLKINASIAYPAGIIFAVGLFAVYCVRLKKASEKNEKQLAAQ